MSVFSFFESSEKKYIKSHLRHLVRLASSDGAVSKEEEHMIKTIAKANGLSASEVKSILENPTAVDLALPDNNEDRFNQMFDLVQMMMADGVVTDAEMDFCGELANRLGFRKVIVGVLVAKIERGIKEGLSKDQIRAEAEAFINY